MLNSLLEISFTDLVDVGFVALLLWALIAWSRRVHANLALVGLAFLGLLYLIALQLDLKLTAWLFQGFFAILVILLVVVFQEDLRRLFEQIAVFGLRRRPARQEAGGRGIVVRTLLQLSRNRTGALLILPGREPLDRHLQGGVVLDAQISEELLLSIFDPHSPGHDGAVLLEGDRLVRFGVLLPLSDDQTQLGPGGTRHAAALGLAERSDALCTVVSEERGTISVATQGQLRVLDDPRGQLLDELQQHLDRRGTKDARDSDRRPQLRRRLLEGGAAVVLALACWMAFVPGSTVDQVSFEVPIAVENMPAGYVFERASPAMATVIVSGPRRELLLAQASDFQVTIDVNAPLVELGRRTFPLSRRAVHHLTGLEIVGVEPANVFLSVRKTETTAR